MPKAPIKKGEPYEERARALLARVRLDRCIVPFNNKGVPKRCGNKPHMTIANTRLHLNCVELACERHRGVVEELLREYIINNGGNPSWVHQTDMHFEALKIAARANPGDDTYEIPLWLPENAKTDWRSHLQADDAPLMRFNNQLESEYSAGAIFPRLLDHARHIELYAVHPTVIAGVQGVLDNFLDKAIAPAVTRLRRALFPITHKRRKVVSGTGAASGASNEMTG